MDVRLWLLRRLALHDELHARDIQSTRRDVGGDQGLELVRPETSKDNFALRLVHVAVEGLRALVKLLLQRLLQFATISLRVAKDNDATVAWHLCANQVADKLGALAPLARQEHVRHASGRLLLRVAHEINGRVPWDEEATSDISHPVGQGCGEEKRLKPLVVLCGVKNYLDVLHEAHVEHLVRFVEDTEPKLFEAQRFALQMILHPSGSANDNIAS